MYCKHCSAHLSDGSVYCHVCGTAVYKKTAEAGSRPPKDTALLYYIFGGILILFGLIPLIFRGDTSGYNLYVTALREAHEYSYISVFTTGAVASTLSQLPNLFMSLACVLSILSGFLLLRRCRNVRGLLIVTAIAQFFSLLCLSILLDLLDNNPRDVIAFHSGSMDDPYFLSDCVTFLRSNPALTDFYRGLAILRNIVAIIVILSVICHLFLAKPHRELRLPGNRRIPHLGTALLLVSLSLLYCSSTITSNTTRNMFAKYVVVGHILARNILSSWLTIGGGFLLLGLLGLGILTTSVKRHKVALPVILILLLTALLSTPLAGSLCRLERVLMEYYDHTHMFLIRMILGTSAILLGSFLWFHAVSRGTVSVGMQIAVPILSILLYIFTEVMLPVILSETVVLNWGFTAVGVFLAITSLCHRKTRFTEFT